MTDIIEMLKGYFAEAGYGDLADMLETLINYIVQLIEKVG